MGNSNDCCRSVENKSSELLTARGHPNSLPGNRESFFGSVQEFLSTSRKHKYTNYPSTKALTTKNAQSITVLPRKMDRNISHPRFNVRRNQNKFFCTVDVTLFKRYQEINTPALRSKRVTLHIRKAIYSQIKILHALRSRYFNLESQINEVEGADYRSAMSEYDTRIIEPFQPGVGFKFLCKLGDRLKKFDHLVKKKTRKNKKFVDYFLSLELDRNANMTYNWNLPLKETSLKRLRTNEKAELVKAPSVFPRAFSLTNFCRSILIDSNELIGINPKININMFDLRCFPSLQSIEIRLDHEKFDGCDLDLLLKRIGCLRNLGDLSLDLGVDQIKTKKLNATETNILECIFHTMISNHWHNNMFGFYNHKNRCLILNKSTNTYDKIQYKSSETLNLTKFSSNKTSFGLKKILMIDFHFDLILKFDEIFGSLTDDIDFVRFRNGNNTYNLQTTSEMTIESPYPIFYDQQKLKNLKKFMSLINPKIRNLTISLHPTNSIGDEFIHEIFDSFFKGSFYKMESPSRAKSSSNSSRSKNTSDYYQLESFKLCFSLNHNISQTGAEILSFYISRLPFLKHLDINLYNCIQLKDRGCIQISSAISEMNFLRNLRLNFGGIFNINGDALTRILKNLQRLQLLEQVDFGFDFCLMFGYNQILDVCDLLKMNSAVKSFSISLIGCDLLDYESFFRLFEYLSGKEKIESIQIKFGNFATTINENQLEKLILDRFLKQNKKGPKDIKLHVFESFNSKFPNLENNCRESVSKKSSSQYKLEVKVEKVSKYVEKNYFFENFVNNVIINSPAHFASFITDFKMCLVENISINTLAFNPKVLAYAQRAQTAFSDIKILAILNYVTNFHSLIESLRTLQPENLKIIADFVKRIQESFDETNSQDKQNYNFMEKSMLKTLKINLKEGLNITDQSLQELSFAKSRLLYLTRLKIEFRGAGITDRALIDLSFLMGNLLKLSVVQFDFSYCRKVTEKGINYIATALSRMPHLEELHFNLSDCNSVKGSGYDDINYALSKTVSLKKLILSYMGCWMFNDSKFEGMATSINKLKMLTLLHLNLSYCKVDIKTLKNFLINIRHRTILSGVAILTENGLLEHDKPL